MNIRRFPITILMVVLVLSSLHVYRALNTLSQSEVPLTVSPLIISPGLDGVATVTLEYKVIVKPSCIVKAKTTYTDVVRLNASEECEDLIEIANLTLNPSQIYEFQVFVTYYGERIVLLHYRDGFILEKSVFALHAKTEAIMGISIMSNVTRTGAIDDITYNIVNTYGFAAIDVYTQKAGLSSMIYGGAFSPGETVTLTGYVYYKGLPVMATNVGFQVKGPDGSTILTRVAATNVNGLAAVNFVLPLKPVFGKYKVVATARVFEDVCIDQLRFDVGWIVETVSVDSCDMYGNPRIGFVRGDMAYFRVIVKNIALEPQMALITVNCFDVFNIPIGGASRKDLIVSGRSEFIIGLQIPAWAYSGVGARVYANAYTDWPELGGVAYCPEVSATFQIS